MLAELLGLKPQDQIQEDLLFASKLYGLHKLSDRMFSTKREDLEEELLQKQIAAMGPNPNDDSLDKSLKYGTAALRASRDGGGFLQEILNPRFKKYHYIETVTPTLGRSNVVELKGLLRNTIGKAI